MWQGFADKHKRKKTITKQHARSRKSRKKTCRSSAEHVVRVTPSFSSFLQLFFPSLSHTYTFWYNHHKQTKDGEGEIDN